MKNNKLIIFAKNPKLGYAKTRIAESAGQEKAYQIYLQLLDHTRYLAERVDSNRVIYYSDFIDLHDHWSFQSFEKNVQQGDSLGDRMYNAFLKELNHSAKAVIIGSDCLALTHTMINQAFHKLDQHDVVVGPSDDGGYYLLGMKEPHKFLFENMPWSQAQLYEETTNKLDAKGVAYFEFPKRSDIDFESDWEAEKQSTEKLKFIYHVMKKSIWEDQSKQDYFTAESMKTEGFIHCCFEDQFDHVLGNYFKNKAELVILKLDRKAIGSRLLLEKSSNNDYFPHIFNNISKGWILEEIHLINNK